MNLFPDFESPFCAVISFNSVIEEWEKRIADDPDDTYAIKLVERAASVPELKNGFNNPEIIEKNRELLSELLSCIFPSMLTDNQISAVTFPWCNTVINPSKKFQKIIQESGRDFCINNGIFNKSNFYIASASFILNRYYGVPLTDFFPIYYNFKSKDGISKHFRIVYNPDFLEILPTENSVDLKPEDIDLLLDNLDDLKLWQEKIPPKSWILKGFGLMNMYDSTVEIAFSNLKQKLNTQILPSQIEDESENESLKSIFNVRTLEVGISDYNPENNHILYGFYNLFTASLLLKNFLAKQSGYELKNSLLKEHIIENKPMIVSDLDKFLKRYPKDEAIQNLRKSGFRSCALIPLKRGDNFLGIAELASPDSFAFNSTALYRINMVYSFLANRLEKGIVDFENLKNSIIQKEYTRLHPSVAWKFEKEAEKYLKNNQKDYNFKEISFQDVVALYGQVDIRNSSETRKRSIKTDLEEQIQMLLSVLEDLNSKTGIEILNQKKFELSEKFGLLGKNFETGAESEIQKYISEEIHPILSNPIFYKSEEGIVADYLKSLDPFTGRYYHSRKRFDDSVTLINKRLSDVIDKRQKEIQQIYPHYFERFKTDGVEHNMYIGPSIAPQKKYDPIYLKNLRLWQLQVICEMLNEHQKIKNELPEPLEVASLILVFNQAFSIRFRMDEKRFDVDGAYNAQYEVIKKRIDKSHIKGSAERITQPGKIAIIYSLSAEEKEYKKYIKFLQSKNILGKKIEYLDVEDFQGIVGMRAIRVSLAEPTESENEAYYDYKDFAENLN